MVEMIRLKKMSNGLYLSGPDDLLPEGFMKRYRGVSPLSVNSLVSRYGSALLYSLNAHSLRYFASNWHSGVSTSFYRAAVEIKTGLSGNRLSFASMAPTAGVVDYLFVTGGGALFKVDSDGTDTQWGIDPPSESAIAADGGAGGELTVSSNYKYRFTYLNSITGTRSNPTALPSDIMTGTVLLLHFTLLDHFLDDSSVSAHAVSLVGGTEGDGTYYKFAPSSAYFDGSGDGLSVPDHADWNFGSGRFTIDGWLKRGTVNDDCGFICGQYVDAGNYWQLREDRVGSSYRLYFQVVVAGTTTINFTGNTYSAASTSGFFHFAFIRGWSGSINWWGFTINGINVGAFGDSSAMPDFAAPLIIGSGDSSLGSQGNYYLDEFRIVKGYAAWIGTFTPDTSQYGAAVSVNLGGTSTSIDLSELPESADEQVDSLEIWRTLADGTLFFRAATIDNGISTYTDNLADLDLEEIELPEDNARPYDWFDDCCGPWNGSMFWITRTEEGERGRVYYSPIGRAEAMEGFIEVSSDDDGLQRITSYAGNLFAISKSRAFQIYGTNPYYSRELAGVPGTNAPHTLVITPFGPMWESQDGPRVFSGGAQAQLLAPEQIGPIFRGKSVGLLTSFSGVVATFARGEYILSDGTQTIAYNIEKSVWRDLGVGCNALSYSPSTDQIAASISNTILDFEKEGTVLDNAAQIIFSLETGHLNFIPPAFVELIRIDADSGTNSIECYTMIDGPTQLNSGTLSLTTGRRYSEFDVSRITNRIGLRLFGLLSYASEIYDIQILHVPLILFLFIGDQVREVPGRLSGDAQTLTFEAFSSEQDLLQTTYIFDRLHYDINTASEDVIVSLTPIGEAAIALATLNNSTRTADEIAINRKGRFHKLTLSGDFTAAIELRRLELIMRANNR